jgi:hypothetical protein
VFPRAEAMSSPAGTFSTDFKQWRFPALFLMTGI